MKKLLALIMAALMSLGITGCEPENINVGTDSANDTEQGTVTVATVNEEDAEYWNSLFGDAPNVTVVNAKSNDKTKDVTTEATTTEATSDTDKSDKKKDGSKDDTKPSKPVDSSCNHNWVSTQVLVKEAWTETVVDVPEKTEKVLVRKAWDETKKVKVKDEWDEQVYVCTHWVQLDTGEYLDTVEAVKAFCQAHNCVSHSREALARYNEDPSVGPGLCGYRRTGVDESKTVHHDAEYETQTIHHDAEYKTVTTPAQTHTVNHPAEYRTVKKCSECGAQK